MINLWEIETVEQAQSLPNGAIVTIGTANPGGWAVANPKYRPIMDALERRSPFGWQDHQGDGIVTWSLLVSARPAVEIRDNWARRMGYRDAAHMDAELA